jgi:hypothetical protein
LKTATNNRDVEQPAQQRPSSAWDRVQLHELVERQSRFPIRQWEANDDVLTAKLAPQRIGRPLLRLRSA